ncbi:hypothetical protein C6500_17230 [Candidatus Poribacteria bacterium]|nr:MAG: hypothetical protein C6500_17230 [Candidatus Poribacteria bacterium]
MLSKKMAVSLTSLIIIFALAFVASPVLALKVTPKLNDDKHDDVSVADGHQVLLPTLMVKFAFDQPVADAGAVAASFEVVGDADLMLSAVSINAANTEVTVTLADDTAITGTTGPIVDKSVTVYMLADAFTSLTTGEKNPRAHIKLNYVNFEPGTQTDGTTPNAAATTGAQEGAADPKVVSIVRAVPVSLPRVSSFEEKTVTGPFQVKIVLTEMPNGGLHSAKVADRIAALSVSGGKATNVAIGVEFARTPTDITSAATNPPPAEGGYDATATSEAGGGVPDPTGRDRKYYPYLATIEPDGSKDKVIVSVKDFKDLVRARGEGTSAIKAGMYEYPGDAAATNGRDKLEVTVEKDPAAAKTAGLKIGIPDGTIVPAGGYLILGRNDGAGDDNDQGRTDSTQIIYPGDAKATPILVGDRQPNQRKYNLIKADLPNLETFLGNGGIIDVMSPGLVISEIMWGSDASLATPSHNQWIELYNAGAEYKASKASLMFYTRGEAPAKTPAVAATATTLAMPEKLPAGVSDRVGTITDAGVWWSLANKGQSGRTGQGETAGELIAVVPTQDVVSMYRVMVASTASGAAAGAMMPEMGNIAAGWGRSMPPAINFKLDATGVRIGSPGAATQAAFAMPPAPPTPDVVVPPAMAADIEITEIMVDTGNGRLPQWIELTNVSGAEKSLAGWSLMIENDATDTDAIGSPVSINLSGTLGVGGGTGAGGTMGKSLLLVAGTARSSSNLSGNARVVDVSSQVNQKGRYTLMSTMAFMIKLVPPQTTGIVQYGDMAGNLDASPAWEIEMSTSGRSSLIRRQMLADGTMTKGTDANGWVLASGTSLVTGEATWYGSDEDAGTPGYDAGGPLPVELSHFRPARDKQTGAVVITWATQSELNNAGFFIKRSNQKDGEFKVINATMIPGAGTTSEKQFYTYTDTTAQPNVVYYYQIEDVSLDGNRQTLTRGIRLKGHMGSAGKLTTTWGDLKTSNE